jgi:hypothetical protein
MSIPTSHAAGTVPLVNDRVRLGGGAGGSRQEVRDRTGKLCEIKGARLQRQCSGLRYCAVPYRSVGRYSTIERLEIRQVGRRPTNSITLCTLC